MNNLRLEVIKLKEESEIMTIMELMHDDVKEITEKIESDNELLNKLNNEVEEDIFKKIREVEMKAGKCINVGGMEVKMYTLDGKMVMTSTIKDERIKYMTDEEFEVYREQVKVFMETTNEMGMFGDMFKNEEIEIL